MHDENQQVICFTNGVYSMAECPDWLAAFRLNDPYREWRARLSRHRVGVVWGDWGAVGGKDCPDLNSVTLFRHHGGQFCAMADFNRVEVYVLLPTELDLLLYRERVLIPELAARQTLSDRFMASLKHVLPILSAEFDRP